MNTIKKQISQYINPVKETIHWISKNYDFDMSTCKARGEKNVGGKFLNTRKVIKLQFKTQNILLLF